MKTRILFILALVTGLALSGNGQSLKPSVSSYDRDWKKVDSLSDLGLPKSALAITNRIYSQAKKENNEPQMIRGIIYRLKLTREYGENMPVNILYDLKKEIITTQGAAKQILTSILAEGYWRYYQSNRYRLQQRSQILNNSTDSIQNWDLTTLTGQIIKNYQLSLANPEKLKSISLAGYKAILEQPEVKYRPTLYDFLTWRALDYYQSDEGIKFMPANAFRINDPEFFSPVESFLRLPLYERLVKYPSDSMTLAYHAICLFQNLERFHDNDKDPGILIDNEICRLKYVYDHFGKADPASRDSLYIDALEQLAKRHENIPEGMDIYFSLANFLNDRGQSYKPLDSDLYKWDLRQAYGICQNAIEKFPESEGAMNCEILKNNILMPFLRVNIEKAVLPGAPSLASLDFRNISAAHFRWIATDPEKIQEKINTLNREDFLKYISTLEVTSAGSVSLPSSGDYQMHTIEVPMPAVPSGYYLLAFSSDSSFQNVKTPLAYCLVFSTRISEISYRGDDGSMEYYVIDRDSGIPMGKVKAEIYAKFYNSGLRKNETRKIGEYFTDENGYFRVLHSSLSENNPNYYIKFSNDKDYFITGNFSSYYFPQDKHNPVMQTWFFTDRSIYRPGQVVYFKGIMLEKNGDEYSIKEGVRTTVIFKDVNGQKIADKEYVTNKYGSFNGFFTAPTGVLTGQMTLTNGSGTADFSVEEYKRPTYEVILDSPEGNYRLGDTVKVTGKAVAYAGFPIDGAQVKFHITRSVRFPFWCRWWSPFPVASETEITEGIVKTMPDGSFKISFQAIPDFSVAKKENPVFAYNITAEVTDQNGETRTNSKVAMAGYSSLLIGINIPDKLNADKDTSFILSTSNLAGKKTPAVVNIVLQRLQQPERIYHDRLWIRPDLSVMSREDFYEKFPHDIYNNDNDPSTWPVSENIFEKSVNTASDTVLPFHFLPGMKKGTYLLTLTSKDPFGQKVERKAYFTLFSISSKEMPGNLLSWFVPLKTKGEPGEKARFLVGSAETDVHVICEIRFRDTVVSREWLRLNNSQTLLEIPVQENYRGNFAVNFVFVRHGRAFQNHSVVDVPYTNKKLDIAFQTFRNKLYPGQDEEWKIRIANASGKGVNAEMLASMYDASLDAFMTNRWNFSLFRTYLYYSLWETGDGFHQSTGMYYPLVSGPEYIVHSYEQMNYFGLGLFSGYRNYLSRLGVSDRGMSSKMALQPSSAGKGMEEIVETKLSNVNEISGNKESGQGTGEMTSQPLKLRKDFRETAFFYPSLVTDSTGSLSLSFKVPESLTRWKMMGLATTPGLEYGYVEKELVTQKELMVLPNAPRFVRQGDTLIFSAKVMNMSDRALAGNVTLEWIDAITQKPVDLIHRGFPEPMPETGWAFTLPVGQSAAFRWKVIIPVDPSLNLVTYRIIARSGNFSDGEEKAIPVLTNRMLVTETLPLPVKGSGKFNFRMDKLAKSAWGETIRNYRLTLEFASNPAWYAIQALPSMEYPQYPSADNIFRSYYANSIASYIAQSDPKIQQVFESWKNLTPDALLSNLEKNQDLKS
ncbi:MAG: alpha-2-macroglobulin family protein, partial [Bacteroidota bacterium]|nr:alpha-2-macroglobulin family protein [Bacteroidota bacterium]